MIHRTKQPAYEASQHGGTPADRSYRAMFEYLTTDLGHEEAKSHQRATGEAERFGAKRFCDELEDYGATIAGRRILELGGGLGALATELASRGGLVISLEPGEGWRKIAADRLAEVGGGQMVGAVGEFVPLADSSVDLIVSLQVLEHVQQPAKVIQELYRVLKPGGQLFMAYENYLGFREPHYDVFWLPLLPKSLGALYLKLRGKDPRFLLGSVTYTTFPAVRRELLRVGFRTLIDEKRRAKLRANTPAEMKWRLLKLLGEPERALRLLAAADYSRGIFRTFTEEYMRKPG